MPIRKIKERKMKKLIFIICLALFSAILTSCSDDAELATQIDPNDPNAAAEYSNIPDELRGLLYRLIDCEYENESVLDNRTLLDNKSIIEYCIGREITDATMDYIRGNEQLERIRLLFSNATDYSTCPVEDNNTMLIRFPNIPDERDKDYVTYLERCIREQYHYTRWPISCATANKITYIECNDPRITSLEGIQQFNNLKYLKFTERGSQIKTLMPVRNLKHLERIELPNSDLDSNETAYLVKLPSLLEVDLKGNHITDLSFFPFMRPLSHLTLDNQAPDYIKNITPLAFTKASTQYLSLKSNKISNINALKNFNQLKSLDLSDNRIASIAPLENKPILNYLNISVNMVTSLSALKGSTDMQTIIANRNRLSDIEVIRGFDKISQVKITNNYISDISPLYHKIYLKDISLDYNNITDVSPLYDITVYMRNSYLQLRFTYNCIPKDNYNGIRFKEKIQSFHFENQCLPAPAENAYVDALSVVNKDIILGENIVDNISEILKDNESDRYYHEK